jgi:hypothetical protein
MSNELKHISVGTVLTKDEYESVTGHALDSQAIGDMIYAKDASTLVRLPIGSGILSSVGGIPVWSTTISGIATGRTAVCVIAASNSPKKEQADFVCSGISGNPIDSTTINQALTVVSSGGGGLVWAAKGTYYCIESILVPSNVTLEFEPGNIVYVSDDGSHLAQYTISGYYCSALITNSDHSGGNTNITIKGVNIDFQDDTLPKSLTQNWAGIWLDNCTESSVQKSYVTDVVYSLLDNPTYRAQGILISNCTHIKVEYNKTTYCGYEGIGIRGANSYIYVEHNYSDNNGTHAMQAARWAPRESGVEGEIGDHIYFNKNEHPDDDICFDGATLGLSSCFASGNSGKQITVAGTVNNIHVDGNIEETIGYEDGGWTAPTAKDIHFCNNIVKLLGDGYYPLYITMTRDGGTVRGIYFTNNTINSAYNGNQIYIATAETLGDIYDVTIEGNSYIGRPANNAFLYVYYRVHNTRILNNTVQYGNRLFRVNAGSPDGFVVENNHTSDLSSVMTYEGSGTKFSYRGNYYNNVRWFGPGEIGTFSGTISTLTQNAFNSIDNPFGQSVKVLDLQINVNTKATSTEPNIDCGIGSSATTDYTTLFDDLPGETAGYYKSTVTTPGAQTVPQLWASGSGNRYLNMSIKDAAATGMVATYTITVMGI